jgi:septum formation protein
VVELVLASASPRRREILRQLGLEPTVAVADLDEAFRPGEAAFDHVSRLAREKAEAVAAGRRDALVVAGDTVVVAGGVLGKPADDAEALEMLLSLAGRTHEVLSALALSLAGRTVSTVARTEVRFRAYGEREARAYVRTGEPLDKAGGYGIQGLGAALVEEVRGDYYTVVGFPVASFVTLLEEMGVRYAFGRLEPMDGSSRR